MPNTEDNFEGTTTIIFDKLPLDALQTLLATDKTNRKAAIKAIFDRSDAEALQLQENLMKHWLDSAIKPPLDTDSLKTALKRTQSSLHYKILCLLLIHQLKGIEPQIDKKELIDYVSQGIASKDQPQIIAALQALPIVMTIGKPSKTTLNERATLNNWYEAINNWSKRILDMQIYLLGGKVREILVEQGRQIPLTLNFLTFHTSDELIKSLGYIFKNSEQLDFWNIIRAVSIHGILYPSSRLMGKILISCLKKQNLNLTQFIALIEQAIINPLNLLSGPELVVVYDKLLKQPDAFKNNITWLITIGIKGALATIMPFILSLPHLKKDELDKLDNLINTVISYAFKWEHPSQHLGMAILAAILPTLPQKQLGDLLTQIQSVTSDRQKFLVENLPNLFTAPQLTQEQFNNLAEILAEEISFDDRYAFFFSNFFKILPSFFLNASPEQKSKLIAQTKAICVNPNFWEKAGAGAVTGYFQLLPPDDFAEVFATIYQHVTEIEKITPILSELLTTSQLTKEQFVTLIEQLDEHFWTDDFWNDEEAYEEGLHREVRDILSVIFQSSYLSATQYSRWFTKLCDLVQKGSGLEVLPVALNSPHLTDDQFNTIVKLVCQIDFAALQKEAEAEEEEEEEAYSSIDSATLNAIFASPKLTQQQFSSLLKRVLEWKLYPETLLQIIPTILETGSKIGTTDSIEEQTNALLEKAISEIKANPLINEKLKDFLYNPVVTTKLVKTPQYLQLLVEALKTKDTFSLELQNFLCHLVISGKRTAEQLNSKLVPIFTKLYDESQRLMQSNKENTRRHSMFSASQDSNEDKDDDSRPRKKARGPG